MVGEAYADVQGESLKAYAALLIEAFQLPDRQAGLGEVRSREIWVALALVVSGCGQPNHEVRQSERTIAEARTDRPLPKNFAQAERELRDRVQRYLHVGDGIAVLKDPETTTTFAFPSSAPWLVGCDDDIGIWVEFGTSVEGDANTGIGNEASLEIATTIPRGRCGQLARVLGREIRAALSGLGQRYSQ
jgi:hypothetical protein